MYQKYLNVIKRFYLLNLIILSGFYGNKILIKSESSEPIAITIEPVASTGCPTPDLRFSRPKIFDHTTEHPYVTFETTQIYLPEDFTTKDIQYLEHIDTGGGGGGGNLGGISGLEIDINNADKQDNNENGQRQTRYTDYNPYAWGDNLLVTSKIYDDGGGGVTESYAIIDSISITTVTPAGTPIGGQTSQFNTKHERRKLRKNSSGRRRLDRHNQGNKQQKRKRRNATSSSSMIHLRPHEIIDINNEEYLKDTFKDLDDLLLSHTRVKRKSGKTTGALRPKGGGDTGSSKSTSRKKDGNNEEDEAFFPHGPDDEESEEVEEGESSEEVDFGEVTEVRFPGEVGPLGDRRLCKIRCVKGKWVGPLCATNDEDDHGQIKFQPLYKSCHVNRIPPHLLLSYRNISVNIGWDLPHGHTLQARCRDLGLYKLLGETRVLCSNGMWAPRIPSCVPTTLLTNYSDDSPPSIRIKIGIGSGAFEPSGVLAVLPTSTVHLDCMYPRRRGDPEWTWTGWFRTYYTGWSNVPEEKGTKYRLTIKDIQIQDSGTYTCASPRGLTNSIVIVVTVSNCPQHPDPIAPLTLRLEGLKLGQRALYTCPLGYRIEGTSNATCLASGNWSSPPPICHPIQCPPLFLEDPHLSLTELNTSAWGRAVFKCSWGYRLNGPPGLECEPHGSWSGQVPSCKAIQCPQPLVPINGRIDGTSGGSNGGTSIHRRYAVGALVTFSCTEGHVIEGEASIVCTETGFWSHPPPFCKSQCLYPGDPPNGLIAPLKFHYDPGDFLSVQCRPGFVEYGTNGPPERPRCLPDGNWSGPVPQCRNYEDV